MMDIPQGYKQTELGIIPEDWEVKPIGDLGRIVGGGTPSTSISQYWNGGIAWYTPAEIGDSKYLSYSLKTISKLGLHASSACLLPPGTILLTTRASIGLSAILQKAGTTNQGFQSVIVYDSYDNEFVYYLLQQYIDVMYSLASGSTFLEISKKKLSLINVACPVNCSEQQAIAEALSDIDGLIAALDKKIAKKRLIKQGAMSQLLTGKKRLPGFSAPWVEKKLGEILDYEQPQPYLVVSTDYVDSGFPVLTAGKSLILGYTTEQFGIYNKLPVIIFDDFTTDSKYISYPFKVKSSAMKMLTLKNNDYDLRLVYELMQQIDFPLKDHQRYWISEYSQLTISLPKDREEQTAIAEILTDMDKEIDDLEAQRDKYHLLKSGMMQKLLTGQIRLKIK